MNFADTILFTGAGFTANFRGFLAREMWSRIFNNPKLNNAGTIKLKLRENFDFERIYSEVFDSRWGLPAHEVEIFKEVVNETYKFMDNVIQTSWDSLNINHNKMEEFLNYFKEQGSGSTGVCFTLNQDLLLEKRFNFQPLGPRQMNYASSSMGILDPTDLDSDTLKRLPTSNELETYKEQLSSLSYCYVKLHGSLKWVDSDDQEIKVLGINKSDTIDRIPLLKWYFQLFGQAITRGYVKLVVIGYGFRDDHINTLLSKAASENNLKIYIISSEDPESFKDRLTHEQPPSAIARSQDEKGIRIWNAVEGYFQCKLSEIFQRREGSSNPELTEIYKTISAPFPVVSNP